MNVTRDAIGDVDGLHSKLERKSRVENSNLSATAQFQFKVHSDIEALHHNVQGYSNSQFQACKSFSGKIGEIVNVCDR